MPVSWSCSGGCGWLSVVSRLAALFAVLGCVAGCAARPAERAGVGVAAVPDRGVAARDVAVAPLAGARQAVLVVTDDWDVNQGTMALYERDGEAGAWRRVAGPWPVMVGRNGLAWGRGLHGQGFEGGPRKVEGDGKAPAGVFDLPFAFAYADRRPGFKPKLPLHPVTPATVCVETPASAVYNRVLDEGPGAVVDYDQPDRMRRDDDLYRLGVYVAHNAPRTEPGAGSCIFFHHWRAPGKPTAGCTAMEPADMERVVRFLDPAKKPVLVQLPRPELASRGRAWGAPTGGL